MKKRVWTVMPVYLVLTIIMVLMALPTLKYNKVLFFVQLGVAIVSAIVVAILTFSFRDYVKKVVSSATKAMTKVPDDYMDSLKFAAAV